MKFWNLGFAGEKEALNSLLLYWNAIDLK